VTRNELYYTIKPLLSSQFRLALRGWLTRRKREQVREVWPILPGSERPPKGWPGWPDGKQFAFVLTHDVEGRSGMAKCRQLMELEKKKGIRSSFNFIPEGDYRVSREFRTELSHDGCEVGVHDLFHDGWLYRNRSRFARNAVLINQYLKNWGAAGFRSGFMFHNLDWLQDLDIQYDASTFDTDPFEPQPDGTGTIFPFWHEGPARRGFVELPYTLPQDSTLFLLLRDRTPAIWTQKLDWIARHGGMAMLIVHPDYIDFNSGKLGTWEYPLAYYEEFLQYLMKTYGGAFWNPLPMELAAWYKRACVMPRLEGNGGRTSAEVPGITAAPAKSRKKIWIDLDNTPHVPLFAPIVQEINRRGYEVVLTARDAFQVCELAEKKNMRCLKIGRHSGKNKVRKVAGLFLRAAQLMPVALRERPAIGLSHGSRSQILICNLLRIPTVLMADYEFAQYPPLMRPTWEMVPEVIPDAALCCPNIKKYPGIKEDIYVPEFRPSANFLQELGLSEKHLVVVVRPPATEAHYHNPEAEKLFAHFMDRACQTEEVRVVLLPRNKKQEEQLRAESPHWFEQRRTIIPEHAVDGLDLVWHSDLVVSGGGTMNREAAALGVPVYSVFRGTIGAVDHQLQKEGRLTLVENLAQVDRIALVRRKRMPWDGAARPALARIVDHVVDIVEHHCAD